MKLNIFFVLAAVASTICATNLDTNAQRMARGLPPLPPIRRATPVDLAKKSRPSGSHHGCNTGSLQCCNSVQTSESDLVEGLLKLLGISVPFGIPIGIGCSPIPFLGKHNTCDQQTACCEGNAYNGIITIGCSPVHIL